MILLKSNNNHIFSSGVGVTIYPIEVIHILFKLIEFDRSGNKNKLLNKYGNLNNLFRNLIYLEVRNIMLNYFKNNKENKNNKNYKNNKNQIELNLILNQYLIYFINYLNSLGYTKIKINLLKNNKKQFKIILEYGNLDLNKLYFELFKESNISGSNNSNPNLNSMKYVVDYDKLIEYYLESFFDFLKYEFKDNLNIIFNFNLKNKYNLNKSFIIIEGIYNNVDIKKNNDSFRDEDKNNSNKNNNNKYNKLKYNSNNIDLINNSSSKIYLNEPILDSNKLKNYEFNSYLEFRNNKLFLWNARGVLISHYFIFNLILVLDRFNLNNILIELGKIQARFAVEMKIKKFGINNPIKLLKSILLNSKILGYGNLEMDYNLENSNYHYKFKFKLNPISENYIFKNKTVIDSYLNQYFISMMSEVILLINPLNIKKEFYQFVNIKSFEFGILINMPKDIPLMLREEIITYSKICPINNLILDYKLLKLNIKLKDRFRSYIKLN